MTKTNPTNRRKFRYSLRTLMAVIVLLGVGLGWFAWKLREAERQRKAVEAIREAGGHVWYDYEVDESGGGHILGQEPPAPEWLRELFGEDLLSVVVHVDLNGKQIGDETLDHLKGLTKLEWLNLCNTQVTDDGLWHLRGLTKLNTLSLSSRQITDVGLEHLRGLTKLKQLSLGGTQLTDGGLEHLGGLTELKELDLCFTEVMDAGLEHLKGLPDLEWLELYDTQVTDDGLEHLKGLTKLEYLDLYRTHVTSQGVQELQEALPNCEILWSPSPTPNTTHDQN